MSWQKEISQYLHPVMNLIHVEKQNRLFQKGIELNTSESLGYSEKALKELSIITMTDEDDHLLFENYGVLANKGIEIGDFSSLQISKKALSNQKDFEPSPEQSIQIEKNLNIVLKAFEKIGTLAALKEAHGICEEKAGLRSSNVLTKEERKEFREKQSELKEKIFAIEPREAYTSDIANPNPENPAYLLPYAEQQTGTVEKTSRFKP